MLSPSRTSSITPGQTVLFEITALAANLDKSAQDRLSVTVRTSTGDEETMTIFENGEEIHIHHMPRAHTDGDSIVYFRKANVVHMGANARSTTSATACWL